MNDISETETTGAQSVNRAIRLLQVVALHNRKGMRLTDLAEACQLQKPTAHRLLRQLIAGGLVMQGPKKTYRLGQFSFELGLSASLHFRLRETCDPYLSRLATETRDTVALMVRSGTDVICLDYKTGSFPLQLFTLEIGNRQPLGLSSAGLSILSALPEEEIERVIDSNEPTLLSKWKLPVSQLREHISRTQQQGYAVMANYSIRGVTGVGQAIRDSAGRPIGAVSISGISTKMDKARQKTLSNLLDKERKKIEAILITGGCTV